MTVAKIVKQLTAASKAYYNTGEVLMSDAEYDALVDRLRQIDENNPYLKTLGSPPAGTAVKHEIPMGSLEKVKTEEEMSKWFDKLPVKRVLVQWKYDGASISLEYKDGKLVRAVSRGDGKVGEDVTANIRLSKHIPKQLKDKFTGFIRGEAILSKMDFAMFFKGKANPRNAGNGAIRSKDGEGCEHLRFIPFDAEGGEFKTEAPDKLTFFDKNGFEVHLIQTLTSAKNIQTAHDEMAKVRERQAYEMDGIVLKCNDIAAAKSMGVSDGRPKAHRAYKFEAFGADTVVESIEWTVGHTGSVVPTFKVQPREIGGVTVSSVLMNNAGYCEAMDVAIGDKVRVIRAGDVIPHIESVIERPKNREWNPPTTCPICKGKLVREDIRLLCKNESCEGQKIRKIRRWLTALDIKYIGPEIEQALWNSGLVRDPADLYLLEEGRTYVEGKPVEMAKLPLGNGVLGEKHTKQILEEIAKTRTLPLNKFMGSLGIKFLGTRQAQHFIDDHKIDTLQKFTDPEVVRSCETLGPKLREEVADGIEANKKLIARLLKYVKVTAGDAKPQVAQTGKPACGKSFCFTGSLPSGMGRTAAQSLVTKAGGIVKDSVSKGLDFLVLADPNSASSKAKKARQLGTKCISEIEFRSMV